MPNEFYYFVAGLFSYLVGAIPFGWVVIRVFKGVDLRVLGSGNIGATNAGREFGFHYFLAIFLLDAAKGFLPVFFAAPWVTKTYPCDHFLALEPSMAAGLALCAMAGHVFPIYLKFKGGKGVSTGLGVSLALDWRASLVAFGVFLLFLVLFRYVSLASIGAAIALPAAHVWASSKAWSDELLVTLFFFLGMVLILVKHRTNMRRLAERTEPKVLS